MPAQPATRPIFWAPGPRGRPAAPGPGTRARAPGSAATWPPGTHQVTRAPAPGRRPPGRRAPAPGPGTEHQGARTTATRARPAAPGTRSAATGARYAGHDPGVQWPGPRGEPGRPPGRRVTWENATGYMPRRCDTRHKKTRHGAGFGLGESGRIRRPRPGRHDRPACGQRWPPRPLDHP